MTRQPRASPRITARLRVALGMAQLFGATFSAALLYDTGINRWSLLAVVLTCALTTTSVLLFGGRRGQHEE